MAQIAEGEAWPVGVDIAAEGDNFEELAHFLRGEEGLAGSSSADVGLAFRFALGGKQVGKAEIEQEGGLGGVADEVEPGLAGSFGDGGEIHMAGKVGEADVFEGIVYGMVEVVADEGAAAALGVVILGGVEAVVDKEQGAAREALGEGADKGLLTQVQFAGVAVDGGQQRLGGGQQLGRQGGALPLELLVGIQPHAHQLPLAALITHDVAGDGVEHFVADDGAVEFGGQLGEPRDLVLVLGQGGGKVAALAFG